MGKEQQPIKFKALRRMAISNSKELPQRIYFVVDSEKHYKMWVGIGWIDDKSNDEAIEVVDD